MSKKRRPRSGEVEFQLSEDGTEFRIQGITGDGAPFEYQDILDLVIDAIQCHGQMDHAMLYSPYDGDEGKH